MGEIFWFLVVGCAAGWLGGKLLRGRGFGFANNLIVGMVGSLVGGLLYWAAGAESVTRWGSLVSATLGSVLFLLALGVMKRKQQ